MRPIYFPFTTISEPVLGALLTCFKKVALYQPSRDHVPESLRNWESRGHLTIHLPDEDENDPLPHLLKAYHAWAEIHKGERPDFEKFRPPVTPYYDASAPSRIRSDVQKAVKGTKTAPSREDKERSILLRARLFLTVAQEHDQLRQALREDLNKIGNMEKDLFRNLISDQDEPLPIGPPNQLAEAAETDRYMSGERMTAWARLHAHHQQPIDADPISTPETKALLITSDQFELEQLLVQSDETDIICSVSDIPFGSAADISGNVFFNEQLYEKLQKLTVEPVRSADLDSFFSDADNGSGNTGRLDIYRVKGDAVASFLSKSGNRPGPSRMHQDSAEKRYTLVGSITKK